MNTLKNALKTIVPLGVFVIPLVSQGSILTAQSSIESGMIADPVNQEKTAKGRSKANASLVSVSVKDSSLEYVITEIARQAHLRLVYDNSHPAFGKKISVQIREQAAPSAMSAVLRGTGLAGVAASDGTTFIIRPDSSSGSFPGKADSAATLKGSITGKVLDSATNRALSDVTVSLDSQTGVTRADGSFIIREVPVGEHTLTVRKFGYKAITRLVRVESSKEVVVQFNLTPAMTELVGVVTTATGEQNKLEVGNSITTLKVDSIMQVAPISSITDLLEARVPGMTVQRTSGTPGDPSRIRLRGAGSIYGNNDPIVIVDGVRIYSQQSDTRNENLAQGSLRRSPGSISVNNRNRPYATPSPIDQIDPATVETIEVMKGPSASALYGSDAANGVIVITTKKGVAGESRWDVSLQQGISYMPGKWPTGYWAFGTPVSGGPPITCLGSCSGATIDSLIKFQALNDKEYTVLGTGNNSGVSTTLSGGSQRVQYSFTGSVDNDRGIMKLPNAEVKRFERVHLKSTPGWMKRPDKMERWGGSGRVSADITDKLNMSITTLLNNSTQKRSGLSNSVESAIRDLESQFIDRSQELVDALIGNPYERVSSATTNTTVSTQFSYRPIDWLLVNGTFGLSTLNRDDQILLDRGMVSNAADSAGFFSAGHGTSSERTSTVNTVVPLSSKLNLAAGLTYVSGNTYDLRGTFRGIPVGVTEPSGGQSSSENSFNRGSTQRNSFGWFMEPRFNLRSRFFVMPGFRLDNNGLSGQNAKFSGFPKTNMSWIISDEPFFPFGNTIQMLRVRAAVGYAGVQPRPGDYLRLYQIDNIGTANTPAAEYYGTVLNQTSLGNSRLKTERSMELEGGFDLELWNNRVALDITYYRKRTNDAVVPVGLAASIGNSRNIRANAGNIVNSGTEMSASVQIIENPNVGWNLRFGLSHNASKVLKVDPTYSSITANDIGGRIASGTRFVEGYPMNGLWARPIYGFIDRNDDGWIQFHEVIIGDSAVFMGAQDPSTLMSLNSNVSLLRGMLSFNSVLSYTGGLTQADMKSFSDGTSQSDLRYQTSPFWLSVNNPGSSKGHQAAIIAYTPENDNNRTNYGMIQTTNALRLQSLSVNLNLGRRNIGFLKTRAMSLSLQGSNLGLWSNWRGKDPNVNAFATGIGSADRGQLPQPRRWQLRVRIGG